MNKKNYALGRLKTGMLNATEAAYAQHLELLKAAGESLILPFPPSLNMMYPTNRQGRRFTSARGTKFKADVAKVLSIYRPEKYHGELVVEIKLFRPKKLGDIDNYAKAILDALKGHCFNDDKQIIELHIYRFDDKQNPRAEVKITERDGGGWVQEEF